MWGCGGVFAVCGPVSEKTQQGEEAGAENWSYIGENGGGYEKVYTYRFVGEGRGDFDFDQRPAQSSYTQATTQERFTALKWGLLCLGASGLIAVAIISTLLIFTSSGPPAESTGNREGDRSKDVTRDVPPPNARASSGGMVFDCQAGADNWRDWSPAKQTYCCVNGDLHCKGPQRAVTTFAPGGDHPFNCKFETPQQTEDWSFAHRKWCCSHEERGCPPGMKHPVDPSETDRGSHAPSASPAPAGPKPTPVGDHPGHKPAAHAGPSHVDARSAELSCGAPCAIAGYNSTCGALLRRMAAKTQLSGHPSGPHGVCEAARSQVLAKCSACSDCTPKAAGCVEPAQSQKDDPHAPAQAKAPAASPHGAEATPSTGPTKLPAKIDMPAGAEDTVPLLSEGHLAAPSATVREGEAYDCNEGITDWPRIWSVAKKAWCCQHKHRGCPPAVNYDCDAGYENWAKGWSLFKKAWCCQHKFKGCPMHDTMQFDCKEGYATWEKTWSRTKQAWCCKHLVRGCPAKASKPEGST